jgi:lysophospholipid acyltransferase (LPLAT)-like uncharacterized protein
MRSLITNKKHKIKNFDFIFKHGHQALHCWFATCRVTQYGTDYLQKALFSEKGTVLMCWHSFLLIPFFYLRRYPIIPLIGTHSDAEILYRIGKRLGYQTIRGSSNRESLSAAIAMLDIIRQPGKIVIMTPDGPKGPARQVKTGTLKIIRKAGASIIPIGAAASRNIIFKSWDKFHLARPFSRITLTFGNPLFISEIGCNDLSEDAQLISSTIDQEQKHAEQLVNT